MEVRIKCKTIKDLENLMDIAYTEMEVKVKNNYKNLSTTVCDQGSYMIDPLTDSPQDSD